MMLTKKLVEITYSLFTTTALGGLLLLNLLCEQDTYANEYQWFDWDDNVVYMPTSLYIFPKTGDGPSREVSSDIFSILRDPISTQEHGYSNYELNNEKGSFLRFSDDPEGKSNYFLDDLQSLILSDEPFSWQGPKWDDFVLALSNETTAEKTGILTSRKQSPETIFEGLQYLQELGLIQHLPKIENIWAVGNPFFSKRMTDFFGFGTPLSGEDPRNAAKNKAFLVSHFLDELFKENVSHSSLVWRFSDDDSKNIITIAQVLASKNDPQFWSLISVELEYTGFKHNIEFPQYSFLKIEYKHNSTNHKRGSLASFRRESSVISDTLFKNLNLNSSN